jgi:NAD(P)H-nitrite reductase large subunit
MATKRPKHVIIGASAAGLSAVEAIRALDPECPVTVISDEKGPPYSRVALSHYIGKEVEYSAMQMRDVNYYDTMRVEARLGQPVTKVNPKSRRVTLADRSHLTYDTLLVGSGSHAVMPGIPGADLRNVFPCISKEDAQRIVRAAGEAKEAVVIGAGLIGIQAVDAFWRRGLKAAVVEKLPHIMPAMVDAPAARIVEKQCEAHGVVVRTGTTAVEILGAKGRVAAVKLDTGETLPCQLLVMAAGVAPNLDFLEDAGVEINRGVIVDETQQSSVPGLYAAGDVAETTDRLSGERVVNAIWPEALNQGKVAGRNMAGVRTTYPGSMAMNTTSVLHIPVASLGLWHVEGERYRILSTIDEPRHFYKKLVLRDGKLVGAVLCGQIHESGVLHNMIESGEYFDIDPEQVFPGEITWGMVLRQNRLKGAA